MQDVESAPRNFDTAAPLQLKQIDGAKAQAMVSSFGLSEHDYYLVTKTRWPVRSLSDGPSLPDSLGRTSEVICRPDRGSRGHPEHTSD